MFTLFSPNYLASKPIEDAMQQFALQFAPEKQVLDIGCGKKPYEKFFGCQYTGIDPLPQVHPEVVGNAWSLPFPDNTFDGVIMNQSLEHIARPNKSIAEVQRVLKKGGTAIITVPQTMKNHSEAHPAETAPVHNFDPEQEPYWRVDYWRFTKFGLIYLFKEFKIVSIAPTNGYISTLCQLGNYFFASVGHNYLWAPIYLVNNSIGLLADWMVKQLVMLKHPIMHKLHHFSYNTLTINYILIVKKV